MPSSACTPIKPAIPKAFHRTPAILPAILRCEAMMCAHCRERLVEAGLSSLGRGESHIQTNLNRVIGMLSRALGRDAPMDFPDEGPARLERHSEVLFASGTTVAMHASWSLYQARRQSSQSWSLG